MEYGYNDLKQLIKLTPMNRNNRVQLTCKKNTNFNFAPVVIKCSTLGDPLFMKNTLASSDNPKTSQLPMDPSASLKLIKEDSILDNILEEQVDFARCMEKVPRKNIYRSRKQKKISSSKPKFNTKSKIFESNRLYLHYRNQVLSLISLLGRRDHLFSILRGKKLGGEIHPLRANEIEEKLQKELNGKGKDKVRRNFNHLTNEQLRSLKYKAKPFNYVKKDNNKGKADDDEGFESENEDNAEDEDEDYTDMVTWKRKNGVFQNQKVFIVKGGYHELRRTLIDKGWAENQDVWSRFYDFKWTTKTIDINYADIKNGQCVNHFNNNHHLTSKYGLARRLRTLQIAHNLDIDRFYPRCYDLGDQADFQNFVQNFKFSFAESVAKRFLIDKQRYTNCELKIRYINKILTYRVQPLSQKINKINNGEYPLIFPEQWEIITQTDQCIKYSILDPEQWKMEKLVEVRKQKGTPIELEESQCFKILHEEIEELLNQIERKEPQLTINGHRNVWIAKPNFLSRGRGIRCFNNLYDIADYCLGRDCQFVIQKYIENPLLIEGKKFDIRQWVLIQDYNPPKIYFFEQCYLRFCMDDYSLDNIHNRFIHLTNNSIQKHNKLKKNMMDESMWEMSRFAAHIGEEKWRDIQEKIKNIVVWSIKSCEGCVTAKKGSMEMVGFDFMIDQFLNPWLIEINMSPSMDSSTPVTSKLVKMVQHDTALVIASNKQKKKYGNYTLIYEGEKDLDLFSEYKSKE